MPRIIKLPSVLAVSTLVIYVYDAAAAAVLSEHFTRVRTGASSIPIQIGRQTAGNCDAIPTTKLW